MVIGGNAHGTVVPRRTGPARRSTLRRLPALLGTVLILAMGGLVLAAPARADSVTATESARSQSTTPDTSAEPGWTLAEGKAAVTSGVISRVDGAPAVVDTDTIRKAVKGTNIRVVMLPFDPLDPDARDAAGMQAVDLKDWADSEKGYELIEVEGLQVVFSIYDIVPDSMAELQPVLAQMDVTHQVLFAISNLQKTKAPPDPTTPKTRTADQGQVDTIAAALAANGIYNDPALATPQEPEKGWDAAGVTVRAAFLPPAPRGTELTDLATALHQRFPGDLVVVVRGRWIEAAGPHQDLVHSSLLWVYGYFSRGLLGWQVEPSSLVRLLIERVALLGTGVVTDQPSPSEPADPVSSLPKTLPWVFAGAAVLIVAVVTLTRTLGNGKRRAKRQAAHRKSTQDRRELGARLAVLAGQVAALDPLVHGHAMRTDFSRAVERYQVAGDTLSRDGSILLARQAIEESEHQLAEVAAAAGVPLAQPILGAASGGGEGPDADAGGSRPEGGDR